jgi:hypothetical protein
MRTNGAARKIADSRELGDCGHVIVGTLVGNGLDPAEQGEDAIGRKQGSFSPLAGERVGDRSKRVPVAFEISHEIQEWLLHRLGPAIAAWGGGLGSRRQAGASAIGNGGKEGRLGY